jgi:hypothetical protein
LANHSDHLILNANLVIGQLISVDERSVKWKGRTRAKQYTKDEPIIKWGFKLFCSCMRTLFIDLLFVAADIWAHFHGPTPAKAFLEILSFDDSDAKVHSPHLVEPSQQIGIPMPLCAPSGARWQPRRRTQREP